MSEKENKKPKNSMLRRVKKVFQVLFLVVLFISILAGGWGVKTGMTLYANADISDLSKEPPRSTRIYDKNGDVITELTNAKIEYIPITEIPDNMQKAIVAIEDVRFYEHDGVDIQSIARAFYADIKAGTIVQGGSTITQQLAKNMLVGDERTLVRKLNEAVASLKIEKNYSKSQILELYLNHIYFGEGAWGIQRAANEYFGKDAKDLTLAECAMLAGLPKAPSNYNPVDHPTKAKERRDLVLQMMGQHGMITAEERDKAINEPIQLAEKSSLPDANKYESYVDHVINEAEQKFKITQEEVLTAGLQIYTNLDPKIQNAAEEVYNDDSFFPESKEDQLIQSGIVLVEPKTGAIRGLVGQRGAKEGFRTHNYATQLSRQPGSTIKPLLVYGPAMDEGFKRNDLIWDEETDFGGGYTPMNYGKEFHGWVTVEEALIHSYNIPAVALLKEVGIGKALEYGKKEGLPLTDQDRVLGIALGGTTNGMSPLTMAQAYTTFPNYGEMAEAYAITRIESYDGKVIADAEPKRKKVFSPSAAYETTFMLQKVVSEGTGRAAQFERPVAGKTGTTQLPSSPEFDRISDSRKDASKDAWFVGYTPQLVAAVWMGYPHTDTEHYLISSNGLTPSGTTSRIFKEVMKRALDGEPIEKFTAPPGYKPKKGKIQRINESEEEKEKKGFFFFNKKDDKKEEDKKQEDKKQEDNKDEKGKKDDKGKKVAGVTDDQTGTDTSGESGGDAGTSTDTDTGGTADPGTTDNGDTGGSDGGGSTGDTGGTGDTGDTGDTGGTSGDTGETGGTTGGDTGDTGDSGTGDGTGDTSGGTGDSTGGTSGDDGGTTGSTGGTTSGQ